MNRLLVVVPALNEALILADVVGDIRRVPPSADVLRNVASDRVAASALAATRFAGRPVNAWIGGMLSNTMWARPRRESVWESPK